MFTNALYSLAEPLLVSFEQTIYEVLETAGQVEVCVILTRPETDIFNNVVGVEVFVDWFVEINEYFPSGAAIASEFSVDKKWYILVHHIKEDMYCLFMQIFMSGISYEDMFHSVFV